MVLPICFVSFMRREALNPGDLFVVTRMLGAGRKFCEAGDLGMIILQLENISTDQLPIGYQAMINGFRTRVFSDEIKHIPESCKIVKIVV